MNVTSWPKWIAFPLLLWSLIGCKEAGQQPAAQSNLRLKTIVSPALSTTLLYNATNQLTAFSHSNDSTGFIRYDSLNRYQSVDYVKTTDRANGWRIVYVYPATNPATVTVSAYRLTNGVRAQYASTYETKYTLNGGHPVGAMLDNITPRMPMPDYATYFYTGNNVTLVRTGGDSVLFPYLVYDYDDKPNPFQGLFLRPVRFPAVIRPAIPNSPSALLYVATFDVLQQYNQNNITKITFRDTSLAPIEYSYQYNEQVYPVTITEKATGVATRLTYESY